MSLAKTSKLNIYSKMNMSTKIKPKNAEELKIKQKQKNENDLYIEYR